MIDLEQRLREDFTTAAGAWDGEIDAADVLSAGRTARRGRTVRRLAVAAAAVVALASVSIVAAPPIIAQILNQRTVSASGSIQWGDVESEFDDVTIQVTREDGVTTAVVIGSRDGKRIASASQVLAEPFTTPVRMRLGKRAVVAVLPGKATGAEMVLWSGGSGGQREWLDTFGITVVVTQLAKEVSGVETMDWVWVDAAGEPHSIDGTPCGRLTLGTESLVVYYSKSQNLVGVLGRFGSRADSLLPVNILDGGVVISDTDTYNLALFPAGVSDVQLTLADPKGYWDSVLFSDGSQVVIAKVPGDVHQVVRNLTYRTADGTTVKLGH